MADSGVYDRWYRTVDGKRIASAEHGQGKRWQARWRDESGRQRKQNHDRRTDAERALAMVKADLARGVYLDPAAGKVTLGDYATAWCAAQTFDETTGKRSRCGCGCMWSRNSAPTRSRRCARASCSHGRAACNSSSRRATSASCSPT